MKKILNKFKINISPVTVIPIAYAIFGVTWVLASDYIFFLFGFTGESHHSIKGLGYIGFTTLLLYYLVRRYEETNSTTISKLELTKNNLNNIIASLDDIIWSANTDFSKFIYLSSSCEKVYGFRKEEFYNNTMLWMNLVHEDDLSFVKENFELLYKIGSITAVHRAYNKQNQIIWVQNKVWLVYNENKEIIRVDGITSNITKQKSSEVQTSELFKEYKFLFDSTPFPTLLVNTHTLSIIKFNRAATDLFFGEKDDNTINGENENPEEPVGFKSLLADSEQFSLITKVLNSDEKKHHYGSWSFKSKDESIFFANVYAYGTKEHKWGNYKVLVLRQDEQYAEHDLKLKRLEKEFSDVKHRLNGMYFATNNYHYLLTTDGKILWANKKADDLFFHLTMKQLEIGIDLADYVNKQTAESFKKYFLRSKAGEVVNFQMDFSYPITQTTLRLDVTYMPIYDRNELIAISLKLIDITLRAKKEEEVLQLQKDLEAKVQERTEQLSLLNQDKDELLSITAHDLRNPLHTILLQTNLIKKYLQNEKTDTYSKVFNKIEDIENTVNKMSNLITNLLEINRLESGKFTLFPILLDISDAIYDEINRLESYYTSKGIELELHLDNNCKLYIDPNLFTQVFVNIFTNAIKYSPLNQKIIISLRKVNDTLQISVKDFGQGISQAEVPLLYKKFTKLSSIPTGGETSSGVGLSIVKKYMDLIDGDVVCESEVGRYTIFTLIFKSSIIVQ